MISFQNKNSIGVFILVKVYLVGIIALSVLHGTWWDRVAQLTPVNLLFTTILLLLFHQSWNLRMVLTSIIVALLGFFIEVIGVHTGKLFGVYHYGSTLGAKLLEVPVVMALNWWILIYCIHHVTQKIKNIWVASMVAAAVMTVLDICIEPVAMWMDFWQWQHNTVPIQNYVAWYFLSFFIFLFFKKYNNSINNKLANVALVIQFIFFIVLNIKIAFFAS